MALTLKLEIASFFEAEIVLHLRGPGGPFLISFQLKSGLGCPDAEARFSFKNQAPFQLQKPGPFSASSPRPLCLKRAVDVMRTVTGTCCAQHLLGIMKASSLGRLLAELRGA